MMPPNITCYYQEETGNNMRYRIVQRSASVFEPQQKGFFGWSKLTDYSFLISACGFFPTLTRPTLKEAKEFIEKHHKEFHQKKYPIIHEYKQT